MDTTSTVRLDTQLKEKGERTLDSLGLSMSSVIRVFLTHVVAQQALPFLVQGTPSGAHGVCATGCFGATSSRQRMLLMGRKRKFVTIGCSRSLPNFSRSPRGTSQRTLLSPLPKSLAWARS